MKYALLAWSICFAQFVGAVPAKTAQAKESKVEAKAEDKRLSSASLFPMALGSRWVYRLTEKEPGEEAMVSASTSVVRGVYLLGEDVWYQLEEQGYSLWLQNRAEGQYEAQIALDEESNGPKFERKYLTFKSNPKVGQKWTYRMDLESEEPQVVECLSVNQPVKVPAGIFRCVTFETRDGIGSSRLYFAPGWGLIKFESSHESGDGKSSHELELMKYFPAKQQVEAPIRRGPEKQLESASP